MEEQVIPWAVRALAVAAIGYHAFGMVMGLAGIAIADTASDARQGFFCLLEKALTIIAMALLWHY